MIATITKEWVFTAAQTDLLLETVGSTQRMKIVYGQATCANSNSVDVPLRVGLATATLPTISNDSATGGLDVFMSHPAIAHGGGMVVSNGGAPICVGGVDADLRITVGASTGGSTRVVVTYAMLENQ